MDKRTKLIASIVFAAVLLSAAFFAYSSLFGASQRGAGAEQFTIPLTENRQNIVQDLSSQGFIKSGWGFGLALGFRGLADKIQPGGYKISKGMSAWQIAGIFSAGPSLKWVVIPEGLRKEQIAELLAQSLGWTPAQKSDWITKITGANLDYFEGVYFPETYLIPKDESPADVAQRLINKFNEKFAPYAAEFATQDVKWTTAIKVASLVQREGLGRDDMPIISAVIWNRLAAKMPLGIDATIQYARDNGIHFSASGAYVSQGSWWSPIAAVDEKIDSPYNTYLNKGLPPHPIDNPGIEAIEATLDPATTACLYYLHDSTGTIHCAATLAEHDANIQEYLK